MPLYVEAGLDFGYWPSYPTPDHFHKGKDWKAVKTICWMREAGTVVWAMGTGQLGNYVAIQTDRDPDCYRGLAHLSEIWAMLGQHIRAGEYIGITGGVPGESGAGLTDGPHLHEEEWRGYPFAAGSERVNPY